MLNYQTLKVSVPLAFQDSLENHREVCRLLAAAVVSPSFCRLLLAEPELALRDGYQDESFCLNDQERDLILSLRANSLAELAWQIAWLLGEQAGLQVHQPAHDSRYVSI
ncbi:MAG: hypothetical protein JXB85_05330 [Anaerolineales bacterium]|nr:hypothetical protein [Anaerolineales bacterium]